MIINNCSERFHYMSGYFECVCKDPEKYSKADLVRYFKIMGRIFDAPTDKPFDTVDIGRF